MSRLDDLKNEAKSISFSRQSRFLIFVFGAIVISLILVFIAMKMYFISGANQLDLSLPAYRQVLDQYQDKKESQTFGPVGQIDAETMHEFLKLYDEQVDYVLGGEHFKGSALSDQSLELPSIQRSSK